MNPPFEVIYALAARARKPIESEVHLAFEDIRNMCAGRSLGLLRTTLTPGSGARLAHSFIPLVCILGSGPEGEADTVNAGHEAARTVQSRLGTMCTFAPAAQRVYIYLLTGEVDDDKPAAMDHGEWRRLLRLLSARQCVVRNCSISRLRAILRADLADALELHVQHIGQWDRNAAVRDLHESIAMGYRECYLRVPGSFEALDEIVCCATSPALVTGPRREGKSALLANWMPHLQEVWPDAVIIQHFAEVDGEGASYVGVLRHLLNELHEHRLCPAATEGTQGALEDLFRAWAHAPSPVRVVVVIDGLDRLNERGRSLRWLPQKLGENISIVISAAVTDTADPVLAAAGRRGLPVVSLRTPPEMRVPIATLMMKPGRSRRAAASPEEDISGLSMEDLETRMVIGEAEGRAPLLDAQERTDLVDRVTSATSGDVIRYALELFADTAPIPYLLGLICASRRGLDVNDICDLLDLSDQKVRSLLADIGHLTVWRGGLIRPYNALVRDETSSWISGCGYDIPDLHEILARHFAASTDTLRRVHETPWHWHRSGNLDALRDCISDLSIFTGIVEHGREHELLGYWKDVGTYREAGITYADRVGCLLADMDDLPAGTDIIAILEQLGAFVGSCGVYDVAERFLDQALQKRDERLVADDPRSDEHRRNQRAIDKARGELGEIQRRSGHYAQAIDNLRRAYESLKADPEAEVTVLAQVANDFGLTLHEANRRIGEYDPLALLREALKLKTELFGLRHRSSAETFSDMALLYQRKETAHLAAALCEKALQVLGCERFGSAYSDDGDFFSDSDGMSAATLDAATILTNLAGARLKIERRATAVALYHRVLEIRERLLRPEHPYVLVARNNAAVALMKYGDFANAEAIIREAIADAEPAINDDHPLVLSTVINLANGLRKIAGRLAADPGGADRSVLLVAEARGLLLKTLGATLCALPSGHPIIVACLDNLAATFVQMGEHELAVKRFEQTIAESRKAPEPDEQGIASVLVRYAVSLRALGRHGDARERLHEAFEIHEKLSEPHHRSSLHALYRLAVVSDDLDLPDACALLLLFIRRHPDSDSPMTGDARARSSRRRCEARSRGRNNDGRTPKGPSG